ncbi:MAG: hypothetical protein HQL69_15815 [Magnetococcales bacterium]|nr:hypothetical protein [Magnetococcales bacterium]
MEKTAQQSLRINIRSEFPTGKTVENKETGYDLSYSSLLKIHFLHGYYNAKKEMVCPDFSVLPTKETAELMKNLDLIFKDEGQGFSISYNKKREKQLRHYVLRQYKTNSLDPANYKPLVSNLSFYLYINNSDFFIYTDIGVDKNPADYNYFFSNHRIMNSDHNFLHLTPQPYVADEDLSFVISSQFSFMPPKGTKKVKVFNIIGSEVYPYHDNLKQPSSSTNRPLDEDRIVLDFANLPINKYQIHFYSDKDKLINSLPVLNTINNPMPLGLINLMLCRPSEPDNKAEPNQQTMFPIHNTDTDNNKINAKSNNPDGSKPNHKSDNIAPVEYGIFFKERSTKWRYFIVPPSSSQTIEDLQIVSNCDGYSKTFFECKKSDLPTVEKARCYVSEGEIPIHRKSEFNFQLNGRIGLMPHATTLKKRLPVASTKQIVPEPSCSENCEYRDMCTIPQNKTQCYSDIYVYI